MTSYGRIPFDEVVAELRRLAPGGVTTISYSGLLFALQAGIDVWEFAETLTLQAVIRDHGTPEQRKRLEEEIVASRWASEIDRCRL